MIYINATKTAFPMLSDGFKVISLSLSRHNQFPCATILSPGYSNLPHPKDILKENHLDGFFLLLHQRQRNNYLFFLAYSVPGQSLREISIVSLLWPTLAISRQTHQLASSQSLCYLFRLSEFCGLQTPQ